MPEYPYPAILIDNAVIDVSTGEAIKTKNDFVRLLTNRCYILQPRRPIRNRVTALDKLLNLFYQSNETTANPILEIEEDEYQDETVLMEMIRSLHTLTQDEKMLKSMDLEEEVLTVIDKKDKMISEVTRNLEEERKQKEEERKQKEEERRQKEDERRQKEDALKELELLRIQIEALKKGAGN